MHHGQERPEYYSGPSYWLLSKDLDDLPRRVLLYYLDLLIQFLSLPQRAGGHVEDVAVLVSNLELGATYIQITEQLVLLPHPLTFVAAVFIPDLQKVSRTIIKEILGLMQPGYGN